MKKIFIIPVLLLVVAACKGPDESGVERMTMTDVQLTPPVANKMVSPEALDAVRFPPPAVIDDYGDQASKTGAASTIDKKIIKEGEIRFKTADIAVTRKALYTSLKKLGGYVAEESETNESGRKEITLNVRVPAKNFDQLLTSVSANAEAIDSKNIRIKDVTTEYIDVTTRLANKKKLEERYLDLLKKGSKISDLLEIENKLTEIRSDIESTQGQLNYMMKQVAYSTLDITFYTQQTARDNGQTFGYKIKNAFASGWHTLVGLVFGFIAWWPIWLILGGLIYLLKKWRRNRKK